MNLDVAANAIYIVSTTKYDHWHERSLSVASNA